MMSFVLDAIVARLRTIGGWDQNHCAVQEGCYPPLTAADYYVAVDEDGVESKTGDEHEYLTEVYRVNVGVWRTVTEVPKDFYGTVLKHQDPYRTNIETLETLERAVITALHKRWEIVTAVNAAIGNDDAYGDIARIPMVYRGRSKTLYRPQDAETAKPMAGRLLRFAGCERTQPTAHIG